MIEKIEEAKDDLEESFAVDINRLTKRATKIQNQLDSGRISPVTFVEEMLEVDSGRIKLTPVISFSF